MNPHRPSAAEAQALAERFGVSFDDVDPDRLAQIVEYHDYEAGAATVRLTVRSDERRTMVDFVRLRTPVFIGWDDPEGKPRAARDVARRYATILTARAALYRDKRTTSHGVTPKGLDQLTNDANAAVLLLHFADQMDRAYRQKFHQGLRGSLRRLMGITPR